MYQNARRHFQGDIIHHSLYTENHIKIRTKLCGQNWELFVVLFKANGELAALTFSVFACVVYKLQSDPYLDWGSKEGGAALFWITSNNL